MLEGAAFDRRQQGIEISQQQVRRLGELHRKAGVENVRGGHALMHEAGFIANIFGKVGQEGDNIVLGFAFNRINPFNVESARAPRQPWRLAPGLRQAQPVHRRHVPRSRTRCGICSQAPRFWPSRGE